LRQSGQQLPPVAIVSANAFDRGLDNGLGIHEQDFILKPVRVDLLLDWLGETLQLEWRHDDAARPAVLAPPAKPGEFSTRLPSAASLMRLKEQLTQGHVRGIHRQLDLMASEDAGCGDFVERLRALARQFELQPMVSLVARALQDQQGDKSPA